MVTTPALIGLDWGSTSLRAWLVAPDGAVLEERKSDQGASTLSGHGAFVAAFDDVAGAWRAAHAGLPVLACGMVGSTHGWLDVPYVRCPAGAAALAAGLRRPGTGDGAASASSSISASAPYIVPGVLFDDTSLPPDVMRGEETQVVGALHLHGTLGASSCVVLPGTHSKWTQVCGERIVRFATHMTGELYAVLRQHSVLGRLMPDDAPVDPDAFVQGVDAARDHGELGLPHQIFAARSLGVTGRLPHEMLADYLSGLLIGHELRAGLQWRAMAGLGSQPLALVGAPNLCARYQVALHRFERPADLVLDNTAPAGLLALARAAGLLPIDT
ncbi:2-dehydro-3-deoxygalactonokinase [Pseudoduganella albidiflava]|uniref:2-dehydro-3-deoxygalactonokinase n=1 Tax=Pseudoduganella albidiflava TaxID=321983 RepID=A0A411X626_9BURK|nr:2-dehydro-3-deoxygalactonokinase [Pseudoduganella albidiflava]QBI04318.1 2-dehydro-3-deoxygalactonokinase [Pseudoduganella albidiflava]GGY26291.1 2-dehydro-3-deoxygalactonokinase [Pseudoduganella albidiflava]